MTEALRVKNLTKVYERFALKAVDFSIREGATVGLIGENGAGKSTLIKAILGIVKPNHGEVSLGDDSLGSNNFTAFRKRIGYMPEDQVLYEWMTVRRTIHFYSSFYETWDFQLSERLAEMFCLPWNAKVSTLSKGMKVKLLLVLTLSHKPSVLLLDEPTAGLDPVMRHEILDYLLELRRRNSRLAILVSSHILSDIEVLTDEVIFLHAGEIILRESRTNLLANWKKVRLTLTQDSSEALRDRFPHFVCQSPAANGAVTVLVRRWDPEVGADLGRYGLKILQIENASLNDIYLGLVRGKVR